MTTATQTKMSQPPISDAPDGEVTRTGDALQLIFRRRYRHPVEKVWAALTVPERLAAWLADARVDLRTGGTIHLNWNKGHHEATMQIVECEPMRTLAWRWRIGERDTLVRFDLAPDGDGDGCELTLTHSGLSLDGARDGGVRAGWHAHLEGFADALQGHTTPWQTKVAREEALAERYPPLRA